MREQLTVVGGPDGAGKSWLAWGFLCAALDRGESVHLVTDEKKATVVEHVGSRLGRDLRAHLNAERLTIRSYEEGGTAPFEELVSLVRSRGVRNVIIDPIDPLMPDGRAPQAIATTMVKELLPLGTTCFVTARTLARRYSAGATEIVRWAATLLEISDEGGGLELWAREAFWAPANGQRIPITLSPGVGVMLRNALAPPVAQAPPPDELPPERASGSSRVGTPRHGGQTRSEGGAPEDENLPTLPPEPPRNAPGAPYLRDADELLRDFVSTEPEPPPPREPERTTVVQPARAADRPTTQAPPIRAIAPPVSKVPRRLLLALYLCAATAFLIWRGTLTLDVPYQAYSIAFFVAEVIVALAGLWAYFMIAPGPIRREEHPPPLENASVDVLILTYNEDLDLLRHTIVAARDMEQPHDTWVCDDGRRPELAHLCERLGVGYITRAKNTHYKAGNINHALSHVRGEFVLILDADHVPSKHYLTRLLGYFRDPKVAHVQVPQVYYNVDSFQHSFSAHRGASWHESSVFHHAILHGLSRVNATLFLGTGALIRRSALDEVGGIAVDNITEDVLTGMRIHARGYQSVFVDEPLAVLLAPDTPLAYAQQRLRWAQGNLEILRTENPLAKSGLSFLQRIAYLNTFGFYLLSYIYLLIYLVPSIYLFTGVAPLSIADPHNVTVVVAFTGLALLNYLILAHPHARLLHSECFKLLNLPINLRASMALFNPGGRAFKVTPKGLHIGLPLWVVVPIALICLFNLAGLGYGTAMLIRGDGHLEALLLAMFWAGFYGVVGALTLSFVFGRRAARESFAFPVSMSARVSTRDGRTVASARIRRLCADVAYCEVRADGFVQGAEIEVRTDKPQLTLRGRIDGRTSMGAGVTLFRVVLDDIGDAWETLSTFLYGEGSPAFLSSLEGSCTARVATPGGRETQGATAVDFLALRREVL